MKSFARIATEKYLGKREQEIVKYRQRYVQNFYVGVLRPKPNAAQIHKQHKPVSLDNELNKEVKTRVIVVNRPLNLESQDNKEVLVAMNNADVALLRE